MFTTRKLGTAVHLGQSNIDIVKRASKGSIDKIFVDWWLLASAEEVFTFDRIGSTFSWSARWLHFDIDNPDEHAQNAITRLNLTKDCPALHSPSP